MACLAKLRFTTSKNCFINLPHSFVSKVYKQQELLVIAVEYGSNNTAVFTWSGRYTEPDPAGKQDWVEIDRKFATHLNNMTENDTVALRVISAPPVVNEVLVEPVTAEDWDILQLNANLVQAALLNQLRVVWEGLSLPIWINSTLSLSITITSLKSNQKYGTLEELTELIISPKENDGFVSNKYEPPSKENNISNSNSITSDQIAKTDDIRHTASENIAKNHASLYDLFMKVLRLLGWQNEPSTTENSADGVTKYDRLQEIKYRDIGKFSDKFEAILRVHSLQEIIDRTGYFKDSLDNNNITSGKPVDCEFINLTKLFSQPNTVFIHSSLLTEMNGSLPDSFHTFLAKVTKIKHHSEDKGSSKKGNSPTESKSHEIRVYVKVVVLDLYLTNCEVQLDAQKLANNLIPGSIWMSDNMRRQLGAKISSTVKVEPYLRNICNPKTFYLGPIPGERLNKKSEIIDAFLIWLDRVTSDQSPLVVSSKGTLITLTLHKRPRDVILHIHDTKGGSITMLNTSVLNSNSLFVETELCPEYKSSINYVSPYNLSSLSLPLVGFAKELLGGLDSEFEEAFNFISSALLLGPLSLRLGGVSNILDLGVCNFTRTGSQGYPARAGLLITGPRGSGKSAFARSLGTTLSKSEYRIYCDVMNCKQMRGKRVESLVSLWRKALQEAKNKQPSIFILDDLDYIARSPAGPEQEIGAEASYNSQIADTLLDMLFAECSQEGRVLVVATSLSTSSIHRTLVSTRGRHFFQKVVHISPPSVQTRAEILKSVLLSRPYVHKTSIDAEKMATVMEGFVAQDIVSVVDRAIHASAARNDSVNIELDDADMECALDDFTPVALQGIPLHKTGYQGWEDVGGLENVKSLLKETLEWPAKYPKLFKQCPLRLRSGILLYGPPGTGKTLLAGVVANECKMHFLCVKGPELLSKYIGASEQAVRSLFSRAQAAKPCILFFDEFDSLAPKRGHDSTGVTDRVVNQLLTQLDGVEGLEGVYVLAATSRPDLIDPALLRPGRLDKSVYCDLPGSKERAEILRILTRGINLDSDVDFDEIASRCEHFSGADLHALLYDAQLSAVHRRLGGESGDKPNKKRSRNTSKKGAQQQQLVYLPSIEDGPSVPSEVTRDRIVEQVQTISDNVNSGGFDDVGRRRSISVSERNTSLPVVNRGDLDGALQNLRPSVPELERLRYRKIYSNFMKSRGGDFSDSAFEGTQRATLA